MTQPGATQAPTSFAGASAVPLPFHGRGLPQATDPMDWPAPRAGWARRHFWVALSFVLCVMLPLCLAGGYLWMRAADQYASEAGFAVRREDTGAAVEILGGLTGLSGASSRDTDILYEYLSSRRLVAELEADLGLSQLWSKPGTALFRTETDPVFALSETATPEAVYRYWPRRVRIAYDSRAGLITLRVTAFEARDAQLIAQRIVERATALINELSAVAHQDALADAARGLASAETRLRLARTAVTEFRNTHQLVDPAADVQAQAGLLGSLQAQLADALIAVDLLRESTRPQDPRLAQGAHRVAVIEARIAAERAKLGLAGDAEAFASVVGQFEALMADREFAEAAYVAARSTYDLAQSEALRQSRYLAAWQQPSLALSAEYPRRWRWVAGIGGFAILFWGLAVLSVYAVRDQRPAALSGVRLGPSP